MGGPAVVARAAAWRVREEPAEGRRGGGRGVGDAWRQRGAAGGRGRSAWPKRWRGAAGNRRRAVLCFSREERKKMNRKGGFANFQKSRGLNINQKFPVDLGLK